MKGMKSELEAFERWYERLPTYRVTGGPARGSIAAALVVLERLKEDYNLELAAHRAPGGSQIKGTSRAAVASILAKFGEARPFLQEGGRTNRGAPGAIGSMLQVLRTTNLGKRHPEERREALANLQKFLVEKVREYHSRQRIKIEYDPSRSTWQTIADLLSVSREEGKDGPVAQYLVGAKLALRFPQVEIGNESYSTADDQLDRPGDFCVGDTAFHVTVSPMSGVYSRCRENLADGLRVYLLVPDRSLQGAKQNAELELPTRVSVESIETFVSQNLEELSTFTTEGLLSGFRRLLETYNERVDKVETDKSMMIEIPRNLRR